jgi:hypothetical protein
VEILKKLGEDPDLSLSEKAIVDETEEGVKRKVGGWHNDYPNILTMRVHYLSMAVAFLESARSRGASVAQNNLMELREKLDVALVQLSVRGEIEEMEEKGKLSEGRLKDHLYNLDEQLYSLRDLYLKFAEPLKLPISSLLISLSGWIPSMGSGGSMMIPLRMGNNKMLIQRSREAWALLISQAEGMHYVVVELWVIQLIQQNQARILF